MACSSPTPGGTACPDVGRSRIGSNLCHSPGRRKNAGSYEYLLAEAGSITISCMKWTMSIRCLKPAIARLSSARTTSSTRPRGKRSVRHYGMPILNVDYAKHVIICNYDKKPGYSGIDNPMYHKTNGISMLLGMPKTP